MKRTFSFVLLASAVGLWTAGCGPNSSTTPTAATQTGQGPAAEPHVHPTEGPHGGQLVELGDHEYHAEVLHEHDSHSVIVYLLDGHAEEYVAIAEPEITLQVFHDGEYISYALKAVAEPGAVDGTASQFRADDDALCHAIADDEDFKGTLQVTVEGKRYSGTVTACGDHEEGEHVHKEGEPAHP